MPLVQITMLQGRTADQKRKIAKRITDALAEEAGARREAIIVAFHEVSKESYASGGELMIDKGSNDDEAISVVEERGRGRPRRTCYPNGSNKCPSTRSATLGRSLRACCRKCGAARCASSAASSLYCS